MNLRRITIVVGLIVVFAALTALYAGLSPLSHSPDAGIKVQQSVSDQVLSHFRQRGDSLGIEAANALLMNFQNQYYLEMALFDSNRIEIPFQFHEYKGFDSVKAAMLKLYSVHKKTEFLPKRI
ncbi:MAG: hypothetical protein OEM52_13585, partial [bacterium]|nr:hypothetical protein [bacterium]